MSVSPKHRNILREPLGDKPVGHLPGIGPAGAQRFQQRGFHKAAAIKDHYVYLKMDEQKCYEFYNDVSHGNTKHGRALFNCIDDLDHLGCDFSKMKI